MSAQVQEGNKTSQLGCSSAGTSVGTEGDLLGMASISLHLDWAEDKLTRPERQQSLNCRKLQALGRGGRSMEALWWPGSLLNCRQLYSPGLRLDFETSYF